MNLRLALCRFLSICAIVGLVLAPLAAPVNALDMGSAAMGAAGHPVIQAMAAGASPAEMADGMPCCPPETPALPDCQKDCPLAALCLAKCFGGAVASSFAPIRVACPASVSAFDDAARDSLPQAPPPRPPRA